MTEGMTEVLMGAIKIEGIGELHEYLHPRKIFVGLVGFVAVARTLRGLIVAENARRFIATDFTADTGFGRVASIGQRAHFSLRLNRICALYCIYKWNETLLKYIIIDINKIDSATILIYDLKE